jgi:hypothetical protein
MRKFMLFVLRLGDTGENYALEKACKQENLKIKFDYSVIW